MINIQKFFLFIFLLFKLVFNQNGIITLPFKKEIPDINGIKQKEFIFPKMASNLIMAELKVGTNPQPIKLRLEFESYLFYIASQSSLSDIKFNQKESKTYHVIEDKTINIEISKLNKAIYSSDYIYYNSNKKYNTTFLLGIDTDEDKSGGLIGLNIEDENEAKKYSKYNFINELKRINIINEYYFSIKYTSKNSGNIFIGDLPHNFDKNYNKEDYRDTYADFSQNDLTWKLKLDKIYQAEEENEKEKTDLEQFGYGYFSIEKNIIDGTEKYKQVLLKTFMTELIDKELCFELKTDIYYSYYCKKEADISKMKNLYFYNKKLDYTFELTYKDVFYYNEYDGYQYLLIVFSSDTDDEEIGYNEFWIFGEPIFRKYQFIFNKNSKRIGLYTNIDSNNKKKSSFFSKNKWYIFLIILLIILCCAMGVLFYLYLKRKPKRKVKANELDDDFDYTATQNKLVEE